jgi:hypothetical protein
VDPVWTTQKVGRLKTLADGLEAPQPEHEDLKLVKQSDDKAFVIVSLPNYMAETVDYSRLSAPDQVKFAPPGTASKSAGPRRTRSGSSGGRNRGSGRFSPILSWLPSSTAR